VLMLIGVTEAPPDGSGVAAAAAAVAKGFGEAALPPPAAPAAAAAGGVCPTPLAASFWPGTHGLATCEPCAHAGWCAAPQVGGCRSMACVAAWCQSQLTHASQSKLAGARATHLVHARRLTGVARQGEVAVEAVVVPSRMAQAAQARGAALGAHALQLRKLFCCGCLPSPAALPLVALAASSSSSSSPIGSAASTASCCCLCAAVGCATSSSSSSTTTSSCARSASRVVVGAPRPKPAQELGDPVCR
jgi:hypothetical protein